MIAPAAGPATDSSGQRGRCAAGRRDEKNRSNEGDLLVREREEASTGNRSLPGRIGSSRCFPERIWIWHHAGVTDDQDATGPAVERLLRLGAAARIANRARVNGPRFLADLAGATVFTKPLLLREATEGHGERERKSGPNRSKPTHSVIMPHLCLLQRARDRCGGAALRARRSVRAPNGGLGRAACGPSRGT